MDNDDEGEQKSPESDSGSETRREEAPISRSERYLRRVESLRDCMLE